MSLDFQKVALELQSAGTLAQNGDWVFEPAFSLPELARTLQGEGPTRRPRRVWGGVGPALGVLRVPVDAAEKFPSVVLPEACEWTP